MTVDNPALRSMVSQRETYEVSEDAFLEYDVEFALSRLLSMEVQLQKKLNELRFVLSQQHDFDPINIFSVVDSHYTGVLTYKILKDFFSRHKVQVNDQDLKAILRRFDRQDKGNINSNDFLGQVYPNKVRIKIPMKKQLSPSKQPELEYVNYLKPNFKSVIEKQRKNQITIPQNPYERASIALTNSGER